MNSAAFGHTIAMIPMVNYTAQRVYDLHQQVPQLQNYNQNLPMDVVHNINTHPEVQGFNNYMPNFHGPPQNRDNANIPNRNTNFPLYGHHYHNSPPVNERNYPIKSTQDRQNHQNRNPNFSPTHLSINRNDKAFDNRDGVSHGWGWGSGGSVGNSPAISALALLGFLFFLNLIQNSLQNNRMMLTTTTTTTSSNMTTTSTGGSSMTTNGRSGRERRKRESDYYSFHRYLPDSIPAHPIRPIQHILENTELRNSKFYQPISRKKPSVTKYDSSKSYNSRHQIKELRSQSNRNYAKQKRMKALMPFMKRLKQISTNCFQLLACTVGRGVIKKYGEPGALMLRSIGRQLLPNTKTHWSNIVVRAMTNGWKMGRECKVQYNKCGWIWDELFGRSSKHKQKAHDHFQWAS